MSAYLYHFSGAVSFFGDGYIHLRTVEKSIQTVIHVRFRTSSQMGLLFLAAGHKDFLLLELISGRLQVNSRVHIGSNKKYIYQGISILKILKTRDKKRLWAVSVEICQHLLSKGGAKEKRGCYIAHRVRKNVNPLALASFQNKFLHD